MHDVPGFQAPGRFHNICGISMAICCPMCVALSFSPPHVNHIFSRFNTQTESAERQYHYVSGGEHNRELNLEVRFSDANDIPAIAKSE